MSRALASGSWKMARLTRRLAVDLAADVLVLGAQLDAADVLDADDAAVAASALDDDLVELLGVGQPAERAER